MSKQNKNFDLPTFYASLLSDIRIAAKEKGYAITIHGSMCRDFDLVVIPWIEEACSEEEIIETIRNTVKGFVGCSGYGEDKPHGRRSYAIYLDIDLKTYIDVSVMPL